MEVGYLANDLGFACDARALWPTHRDLTWVVRPMFCMVLDILNWYPPNLEVVHARWDMAKEHVHHKYIDPAKCVDHKTNEGYVRRLW